MKKVSMYAAVIFTILSCAGAPVKQESAIAPVSQEWIKNSNAVLLKHTLPDFSYKNAAVPDRAFHEWIAVSFPAVTAIVSQLPPGYVLQVTGHADASGPEYPEGNRPGNLRISQDRALRVRDALVLNGLDPARMTAKGAGTSELLPAYPAKSMFQRRVTFKVVPQ